MELALTGIRSFDSIEQVQRLFMAEWLLRKGETPQAVLTYAGIIKYNPYHLGPGPGGGQFTTSGRDGTSNGLPVGAGRRDGSLTLRPSSIPVGGVQVGAAADVFPAIALVAPVIGAAIAFHNIKPISMNSEGDDKNVGSTNDEAEDNSPQDKNNVIPRPDLAPLNGGRSGENVKGLSGPPNSAVPGNKGRIADEIMSGANWVRELLQGSNSGADQNAQSIIKPEGIPDDWIEKDTDTQGGKIFTNPKNPNDVVRVMPANPNSRYPWQQVPYVIDQNGGYLDVNGNPILGAEPGKTPEAHIPLSQYKFRR